MLIIITSRSSLKLSHVGSKTRSLGQILEKPCVHSRRHRFDHMFMKLCQIGRLVGCLGFSGSLRQYVSLYRAVS